MKRQKIKLKYRINDTKKETTISEQSSLTLADKLEKKIGKTFITFGLILLLLFWGVIPIIFLTILGIDEANLSMTSKVIISSINDILLIFLLMIIYQKTIQKDFSNFFNSSFSKNIKTALRYWGIGVIIMYISNIIISILTNGQLAANEEAVRSLIDTAPLYMAFQLIIYAPITEEFIFRKSIKDITQNKYLYIFISGLVFGGLHVLSSLKTTLDLLYLIPYCALGFAFAALYHKTDNIFSTITMHAFHNSLALILYLIAL